MNRILICCLPMALLLVVSTAQADKPVSFRNQVAQILLDNCLACHGPKKAEGGYRVDSFERVAKEGDSGSAAITAKMLDDSELYRRLISDDAAERMPLEGEPLKKEQIALIKKWIEEGAKFDGKDAKANLATIVPPPVHPAPPEKYPHTLPITALVFSPDGKQLVASGYHELTVWNPADGKLIRRIKNVGQRSHAISFSPDGKLLAVAGGAPGRHGEIRIFQPTSGKLVRVMGTTTDVVLDIAFNSKGTQIAAGGADGIVRILEVATGKLVRTITSHSDWIMAVSWSPDDKQLATASRDKTAKVFNLEKGELTVTYSGHGQPVKGVLFHPDGKEVFSSGTDKKIHRWKVADGKKSAEVAFGGEVYKLIKDGTFFFTASADKTVRQFEAKTHKQVRSFSGHTDWALATASHGGTKRLASGGFNGEVRIWNLADGKPVVNFVAAPGHKK